MPTQEEFDAASSFFEDCNDPYGKRIDSELAPRVQAFLAQHPDRLVCQARYSPQVYPRLRTWSSAML